MSGGGDLVEATQRYECPVDGCGWHLDRPWPELPNREAEDALREHLEGHTTEEWLRTVAALRERNAQTRKALEGIIEWGGDVERGWELIDTCRRALIDG